MAGGDWGQPARFSLSAAFSEQLANSGDRVPGSPRVLDVPEPDTEHSTTGGTANVGVCCPSEPAGADGGFAPAGVLFRLPGISECWLRPGGWCGWSGGWWPGGVTFP